MGRHATTSPRAAGDSAPATSSPRGRRVSRHPSGVLCTAVLVFLGACGADEEAEGELSADRGPELRVTAPSSPPAGMVWIPGGIYVRGSERAGARADERPAHRVAVNGFWMDTTEVTNRRFARFAEETGYVTTAERPLEEEELRAMAAATGADPEATLATTSRAPGSLVFFAGEGWRWVEGASWRHPRGPGSDLAGRMDHPVVHVSYADARAFLAFEGKRLPTEAEWERAARGGLRGRPFVWGDEAPGEGPVRANIWQGSFPEVDLALDGYPGTAPVRSFPPNAYGLFEMAGNVWEWCADRYRPDTYLLAAAEGLVVDPEGPTSSANPRDPGVPLRVLRGGSYLCAEGVCEGYRPSSRMSSSPDSGLCHVGFRGVMTPSMRAGR